MAIFLKEKCEEAAKEISILKDDLNECRKKKDEVSKHFTRNIVSQALREAPVDTPYLKQLYRAILQSVIQSGQKEMSVAKVTYRISKDSTEKIEKCISDKKDAQLCTKILLNIFSSGTLETPNKVLSDFLGIIFNIDFYYLLYFIIIALILVVIYQAVKALILAEWTMLGLLLLLFSSCFIASVPWEWMRLYRSAMARKTAAKFNVPEECFTTKMSYGALIKWWLRDTFSFAESSCSKYYDSVIVDPIWEVTPGEVGFSFAFLQDI